MVHKITKCLLIAGLSAAFSAHAVGKTNQAGTQLSADAQKACQDYLANPAMSTSLFPMPARGVK